MAASGPAHNGAPLTRVPHKHKCPIYPTTMNQLLANGLTLDTCVRLVPNVPA